MTQGSASQRGTLLEGRWHCGDTWGGHELPPRGSCLLPVPFLTPYPANWGFLSPPGGGRRACPGTQAPPFLCTHPKSFAQPYHIQLNTGQGRESEPETAWGCPTPKAAPLPSALPGIPYTSPILSPIGPASGWAQPAERGAG